CVSAHSNVSACAYPLDDRTRTVAPIAIIPAQLRFCSAVVIPLPDRKPDNHPAACGTTHQELINHTRPNRPLKPLNPCEDVKIGGLAPTHNSLPPDCRTGLPAGRSRWVRFPTLGHA